MNPNHQLSDWVAEHSELRAGLDLLAAWIDSRMAYGELPGLSAGIVRDQKLIWARGFGLALPFTRTAIAQLRDAGNLRVDDPVDAHLPWFAIGGSSAEAPASDEGCDVLGRGDQS